MAVTTFIPEIWNARLLYALEKAHVATNLVNRNYEGEISNHGDTVHINTIGAITVKSYTKNTDIADPEVLSTTDQTLVIDQSKYFNFQVDDVDKVQAAGELVDTAMGRAAYALADVSDAYLLGVIAAGAAAGNTIGSAAAPVALTASNVYENIVKLKTKLDKANVPNTGRTIVVPPDVIPSSCSMTVSPRAPPPPDRKPSSTALWAASPVLMCICPITSRRASARTPERRRISRSPRRSPTPPPTPSRSSRPRRTAWKSVLPTLSRVCMSTARRSRTARRSPRFSPPCPDRRAAA